MVDSGGDISGPGSGFGEVNGGGLLHSQHSLASVQLGHLRVEGCLLIGKLVVVLSYPPLSVDLLGTGSRMLLLLVSLPLIGEQFHSRLGYRCPHHDRRDALRARVFSEVGMMVMGSVRVTMLHPQGPEDPELPSAPEAAPPSLEDFKRVVHREGDPLWTIPMNMTHESHF
jgi:hypothetical protein